MFFSGVLLPSCAEIGLTEATESKWCRIHLLCNSFRTMFDFNFK